MDVDANARQRLAERIAGEIALSEDTGATLRKWRTDFGVSQTELADQLDISSSVISDYESGRRTNPGSDIIGRLVEALLVVDERRGGSRIRQHARVLSAGFDREVVHELKEYPATIDLDRYYDAIGAAELVRGRENTIAGHTIIDSIAAITRLSSEEFYRLYGQSANRALVFSGVTRGESPLVAMRVVNPTPNVVVLQGIDRDDVWEHATELARVDGFSLAVLEADLETTLQRHRELP
ncbi:helix-turn-helix domain-containing protein [Halapricum hydrolyticum]|uniref:Helix-turn-helix domain-containing protein n=1 Tax=Halapricum hydrolyticum TaxID=2979991 RepID=A0AAE3IDZ4_9EURY|nr:helix-turn-helix domain-containing protein [Halapricum hydrolyticum]MCU4719185.1 helix-turn-helix domain-containing protein [Halapricum hydrolyticum]MCU4728276.1 helix-turn-helix domain-containing protein [Halapricum hydrolyticum]